MIVGVVLIVDIKKINGRFVIVLVHCEIFVILVLLVKWLNWLPHVYSTGSSLAVETGNIPLVI